MRAEERDPAILWDMQQVASEASGFLSGRSWADFATERLLRRAVEQCVWQMGRLSGKLSKSLRAANPDAPWDEAISVSDGLLTGVPRPPDRAIWDAAITLLPRITAVVQRLMPPVPSDGLDAEVKGDGRSIS